jgi:molybdenum cofactor guanylyltransferase
VADITGFILAGGRSTRMGDDKAFLDWHGRPLLDHALALARSVAAKVHVVGSRVKFGDYGEVVEDTYADRGPLAGIHAALAASTTELNLVMAVDMPFIEPRFLEYLAAQTRAGTAAVTLPRIAGRWQPLCAVYRRVFLGPADAALRAGRNKIDALFAEVPVRIVDEDELRRLAFAASMFDNLNTREEFEQARSGAQPK